MPQWLKILLLYLRQIFILSIKELEIFIYISFLYLPFLSYLTDSIIFSSWYGKYPACILA